MKENENAIGYYSVIPATVLYNKELKANEKLLYAIITSLACKEGYCFATNEYLAKKLGVNRKTVSNWVTHLEEKKFIIREVIKDENQHVAKRKIYLNDTPYPSKNRHMYPLKNGQAIHQNTEDNNIRNNNITNKKGEKNYNPRYEGRKYPDGFFDQFYAN